MDKVEDYDALVGTTDMKHVTSDHGKNIEILNRLKQDDPELNGIHIHPMDGDMNDPFGDRNHFNPIGSDLGWLGYLIGKHTHLWNFTLGDLSGRTSITNEHIETFCKLMSCNQSIAMIRFVKNGLLVGGDIFRMMRPFFKNCSSLVDIDVDSCQFPPGCAHQFALVLRECNSKRLENICLANCRIQDGELVEVIESLGTFPNLKVLSIRDNSMGRNACASLANILQQATFLEKLSIGNNEIEMKA